MGRFGTIAPGPPVASGWAVSTKLALVANRFGSIETLAAMASEDVP